MQLDDFINDFVHEVGMGLQEGREARTKAEAEHPQEELLSGSSKHRAEVTFEARQDPEGRPVIGLVLTRDGRPASGETQLTFELTPEPKGEELDVTVEVLNRCVTQLAMATPDRDEAEGGSRDE